MRKIPYQRVISAVAVLLATVITYYTNQGSGNGSQHTSNYPANGGGEFILTKHAKCRMGCRQIDLGEIHEVDQGGQVNTYKSNPKASPCPIVTKEKRSSQNQLIRVVIAECPSKRKIVTVIDLENKYNCKCR